MIVVTAFWQPMGGIVYQVPCVYGHITMYALYGLGWDNRATLGTIPNLKSAKALVPLQS